MRIRTQNRTMLLEIDNFIINDKAQIIGYSVSDPTNTFLLGEYKTIEDCINVLDAVQTYSKEFNMPESSFLCKSITKLDVPGGIVSDLYELGIKYAYEITPRILGYFSNRKSKIIQEAIDKLSKEENCHE